MYQKLTYHEIKDKVDALESYLGELLYYEPDTWPHNQIDIWVMEYCHELKHEYYKRLKKAKKVMG